jgi:hypothetical protein
MAHQKFGGLAEEFLTFVERQMGVEVFMLIGYKNQQGEVVRAK